MSERYGEPNARRPMPCRSRGGGGASCIERPDV